MPSSKICLGVPLYGRVFDGVSTGRIGARFASCPGEGTISYDELTERCTTANGFELGLDTAAQAPVAWNATGRTWMSLENHSSALRKAQFTLDRGLAGFLCIIIVASLVGPIRIPDSQASSSGRSPWTELAPFPKPSRPFIVAHDNARRPGAGRISSSSTPTTINVQRRRRERIHPGRWSALDHGDRHEPGRSTRDSRRFARADDLVDVLV